MLPDQIARGPVASLIRIIVRSCPIIRCLKRMESSSLNHYAHLAIRVPFILFTGKGREEVVIEAINNGADAYLQKVGEPRSLFAELEHRIVTSVQKHNAEEALLDSESEFRTLFENRPRLNIPRRNRWQGLELQPGRRRYGNATQGGYNRWQCVRHGGLQSNHTHPLSKVDLRANERHSDLANRFPGPSLGRYDTMGGDARLRRQERRTVWGNPDHCQGHHRTKEIEESLRQNNEELNAVIQQLAGAKEEMSRQLEAIILGQDELKREKARSETLVEGLPGIFYIYDAQTMRLMNWNKNHQLLSGYADMEMLGKHVLDWSRPRYAQAVLAWIENCMVDGKASMQVPLLMKDGREVPFLLTATRLDTKDGSFFMGVGIDITERVEVDRHMQDLNRELVEKESRLSKLMEQTFDAIVIHRDGKIVQANDAACKLMGVRSFKEHIGRPVSDFAGPGSEQVIEDRVHYLYFNPGIVAPIIEERFRRLDGKIIDVEVMATSYLEDSKPTVQVVFRDVTERRRLEKEVRDSEEFHRQLMSNLSIGVIVINPMTHLIESANEAATTMFGCPEENIVGQRCNHYLCPGLEGSCPVYDGGIDARNLERTLMCADGRRRPILKTVKKITIHGQEKMLECFMDITEREQAQSALRETNKKLNLLSNITRHDIKNQLMSLRGNLSLFEMKHSEIATIPSLGRQRQRRKGSPP